MEFELEEFIIDAWLDESDEAAGANHAPAWCHDRTGQTGVWIPEESAAPTSKQLEPAD
jgi:hypothetical protein